MKADGMEKPVRSFSSSLGTTDIYKCQTNSELSDSAGLRRRPSTCVPRSIQNPNLGALRWTGSSNYPSNRPPGLTRPKTAAPTFGRHRQKTAEHKAEMLPAPCPETMSVAQAVIRRANRRRRLSQTKQQSEHSDNSGEKVGHLSDRVPASTLSPGGTAGSRPSSRSSSAKRRPQSGILPKAKALEASVPSKEKQRPFQKFLKVAKAIKLLNGVTDVCRDLLACTVSNESFYKYVDEILNPTPSEEGGKKSEMSADAYEAVYTNPNTNQKHYLSFDKAEFGMGVPVNNQVPSHIKYILSKRPGLRSPEEVDEVVQCFKRALPSFRQYTLSVKRRMAQCCFYDQYYQGRVILRDGLPPDGYYYVLTGCLHETSIDSSTRTTLLSGDKFGEEDLKRGCLRKTTVITKTYCDLIYIHKQDYVEIFNMVVTHNLSHLDICLKHPFFRLYPLKHLRMEENSETWTVFRYKFGQLISEDHLTTEFIYVVKSGEARAVKKLTRDDVSVKECKKHIMELLQDDDPYYNDKQLVEFLSENVYRTSVYKPREYHPIQGMARSPPSIIHRDRGKVYEYNDTNEESDSKSASLASPLSSSPLSEAQAPQADEKDETARKLPEEEWPNDSDSGESLTVQKMELNDGVIPSPSYLRTGLTRQKGEELAEEMLRNQHERYATHTSSVQSGDSGGTALKDGQPLKKDKSVRVPSYSLNGNKKNIYRDKLRRTMVPTPHYAMVDSLHAGCAFGLRSVLSKRQIGTEEPAALISAGCEVIQIKKKFFIKFLDENMKINIEHLDKPYPTRESLLERFDVSLRWEEYCSKVLADQVDRASEHVKPLPASS